MFDFATRAACCIVHERQKESRILPLSLSFPFPLVSPSNILEHACTHTHTGARKRYKEAVASERQTLLIRDEKVNPVVGSYPGLSCVGLAFVAWHCKWETGSSLSRMSQATSLCKPIRTCPRFQLRLAIERVESADVTVNRRC